MTTEEKLLDQKPSKSILKNYPEYRIYKPRKEGGGTAVKFQLKKVKESDKYDSEVQLFLVGTSQKGTMKTNDENAAFNWDVPEECVTFKLGITDVSEWLSVLTRKKEFVGSDPTKGLFHSNLRGNSVLTFKLNKVDGKIPNYYLTISAKRDGKLAKVSLSVTLAEAEVLRVLFESYIKLELGL